MAEVQFTFRGITFNNSYDFTTSGVYMLVDIPEGLRSPEIRHSESSLQNRHGVIDGVSYFGKRVIVFTGRIIAETQSERKSMEEALKTAFTLDGVQYGDDPSYYTLYMTDEDGSLKQMAVKVNRGIEFSKTVHHSNVRDFMVELKAFDPVWYSQTLYDVAADEGIQMGTVTLPTTLPLTLGSSFLNEATITNSGNFVTFPVITLTGEGENPVIYNVTTGDRLTLQGLTLTSGDTVIIDCKNGTITLNGSDALTYMTSDSRFISLASGSNTIQITDDSPMTLNLDAQFEYRYAWV